MKLNCNLNTKQHTSLTASGALMGRKGMFSLVGDVVREIKRVVIGVVSVSRCAMAGWSCCHPLT